jgi:hypothetical protein
MTGGARRAAAPSRDQQRQHRERRDEPVAGRVVVEEHDVARLLAAEVVAAADHLLDHVAVADGRRDDADAALAHRDVEAQVAHHGRDERRLLELAARRAVGARSPSPRRRRRLAALVDEDGAVGVAVEGDADVRAVLARTATASASG